MNGVQFSLPSLLVQHEHQVIYKTAVTCHSNVSGKVWWLLGGILLLTLPVFIFSFIQLKVVGSVLSLVWWKVATKFPPGRH